MRCFECSDSHREPRHSRGKVIVRALVVDDHEFTREGVGHILTDNFDIVKLARVGNYEDAMEQIQITNGILLFLISVFPEKMDLKFLARLEHLD